jgi:hypothetical protein
MVTLAHQKGQRVELCGMQIHVGDHVCTCHCGAKKEHDSAVNQIADLLQTTTKVTTTKVARSRGQRCRGIELAAFLADAAGPINLVMDLRIAHECLEVALILAYTTFAIPPANARTSDRLHYEHVRILFLQAQRETDPLFCSFRS